MDINKKSAALSLGIVFAVLHTLVVIGMRLGLVNYWKWAHLVNLEFDLAAFSIAPFITGVIGAFVVGLFTGWLFAVVYNKLQ